MNKVLFISSEAFPLIKTGGLGDVAGSLPSALLKEKQDVRLLLPAYPEVMNKVENTKKRASMSYYNLPVDIIETRLPGTKVTVWLVDCPAAFDRPGGPYNDAHGHEWHDNALRFTIFCHAAVDIALNESELNWQPDIVHCNDWQAGLVPALLSLQPKRPATIFTIHNLAYQGVFSHQAFNDLHLPGELWSIEGIEFYGNASFIKGGIAFADKVTTVSPTYAKEILSPEFGYGLDGLLNSRGADLSGILNGIDDKHWNPGTDKYLEQKYNWRSIDKKTINKTRLQEELSLPVDDSVMMIGMVSRLVEQKGLDMILQSLPMVLPKKVQFVVLGTGEIHYEIQLTELAQQYPDQLKVIIGYNEPLAHRIEAASDVYMMPSIFEPCGLNQLYSLRYGTLPVVTPVGGLADTVFDANEENIANNTANGFVVDQHSASGLYQAISHALECYAEPALWHQLQKNAMKGNFSWQASAEKYIELYEQLVTPE